MFSYIAEPVYSAARGGQAHRRGQPGAHASSRPSCAYALRGPGGVRAAPGRLHRSRHRRRRGLFLSPRRPYPTARPCQEVRHDPVAGLVLHPQDPRGRRQGLHDLPPAGPRDGGHAGRVASLHAQGPPGEPPPVRGRRLRHPGRHRGARPAGTPRPSPRSEIAYRPARVLLQDFTGVPAVVDLAAMRDAMAAMGGRLVEDQPAAAGRAGHRPLRAGRRVRHARGPGAATSSSSSQRNRERYVLLRWAQSAFDELPVVPPATGIVHQVNIEHLARTVFAAEQDGRDATPIPTP